MTRHSEEQRAYTRREFVGTGLVLASAAMAAPAFIQRSAFGMPMAQPGATSIPGAPEDHVLVLVQLGGGNDGLNTVVPFGFDEYYAARPRIAVPGSEALTLGAGAGGVGFHPALAGLKELYDDGTLGVVQGVGYPNPNRSHFTSMDIWQTADTSGTGDGWIGRYLDAECCGYGKGESGRAESPPPNGQDIATHPPVSIGREAPLALKGRRVKPIAFETAELFRWTGEDVHESLAAPYEALNTRHANDAPEGSNRAFLTKTAFDAQIAGETIRKAVDAEPLVAYPRSDLAEQLRMVSGMIRAGMKTRVYYVTHGGFDTHAQQGGVRGRHAQLLRQFADAMNAFQRDLKAQGNQGRVVSLAFSEFGRRVGQNASGGTDHGTAAPVFMFGERVSPGVLNPHPSMTDLDNGDLKYTVDFRTVYAAILEKWLGADSEPILRGRYRPAPVIRRA